MIPPPVVGLEGQSSYDNDVNSPSASRQVVWMIPPPTYQDAIKAISTAWRLDQHYSQARIGPAVCGSMQVAG